MPPKKTLTNAIWMILSGPFTFPVSQHVYAQTEAPHSGALPTVNVTSSTQRTDFQAAQSEIGAKTPTTLRDIPQTVTVINQAVLQSRGATSFEDALRSAPGITLGAAEGGRIGNDINLRGFNARTDIYLDGLRDRGQFYRDTFNLEAIEVLYGPASMLFGRGSTGGVVNQRSKKATLRPLNKISATVGTDAHLRTSVDVNRPISDTAAFRLNAFGQRVGSSRDVIDNKDYGIAPQLRLGLGTPTEVTLSALIQHNRDVADYGIPVLNGVPASVGHRPFYGMNDDRTIQDAQVFTARIKHTINPNLTLRNQTRFARYRTDARVNKPKYILTGPTANSPALDTSAGHPTSLAPAQLFVGLLNLDRILNDRAIYNDTNLTARFLSGALHHELVTGLEVGRDTHTHARYPRGDLPVLPLLNPPGVSTPPGMSATVGRRSDASASSFAVYANDTVSFGERWKWVGGIRWDRYKTRIEQTGLAPAYANQTDTFTSVRTGLIYQPDDQQSYYVSYGTSFNPSLEQFILRDGTQFLSPEKSRSFEIGGKWEAMDGRLSLTSALFRTEKTNARTRVAPGEYMLDGKVRISGWQVGASGYLMPRWQVFGGYTLMNARIISARDGTQGNTPGNTPRQAATLWSSYEITPHWVLGAGMSTMSSRYLSDKNNTHVGGYTRWDAALSYRQPAYDIRVNILNLTNKRYYEATYAGGLVVPARGRAVLATLDYRF